VGVGRYGRIDGDPRDLVGTAVEGEGVPDARAERVGEAALDDHPARPNPAAGGERELVELRGAGSRPSSMALVVIPCARTSGKVTGYGPLYVVTPGARSGAARSAGLALPVIEPLFEKVAERLATTSGPLVAARVVL